MVAETLVEIRRGSLVESVHLGHAAVCDVSGNLVDGWGDPDAVILPRSSCKMIQALPLIESGAADRYGLSSEQLALACASHQGAPIHTDRVGRWLADLSLTDDDLRCGPEFPRDEPTAHRMIRAHGCPAQVHNNCSGKHAGFLALTQHLGAGPEYVEPDHPVQVAIREAFEDQTDAVSPGFGIDGCSAPNFATTVAGLARAMAQFARPADGTARGNARRRLFQAMVAHPDLVAGEGRACTGFMRAMNGRVAVKTGAEGVFTAIVPEKGLGIALKIVDGATRGSECVLASILIRLGVLDPNHPVATQYWKADIPNRNGLPVASIGPVPGVF